MALSNMVLVLRQPGEENSLLISEGGQIEIAKTDAPLIKYLFREDKAEAYYSSFRRVLYASWSEKTEIARFRRTEESLIEKQQHQWFLFAPQIHLVLGSRGNRGHPDTIYL